MREILFRGKRVDNGEWVYGVPVIAKDDIADKDIIVMVDNPNEIVPMEGLALFEQVDPETVGQYTGLTDKNGTRVFEGDILKIIHKYQSPFDEDTNEYTDITTDVVHFDDEGVCFSYGKSPFLLVADNVTAEYEVVGNVHDGGAYD